VGTHGTDGETHDQHPYKVVGILKPTGSIVDMLLLTNTVTVWQVHHHEEVHEANSNEDAEMEKDLEQHEHDIEKESSDAVEDDQQITAALFKFRTPMGIMTMPRMINSETNLQAAVPAIEVRRLLRLMSVGTDTLTAIGGAIMLVSVFSIFISLFLRLKDRQYEMALMRTIGCPRIELLWLVLGEGLFIAGIGGILGLLLSRLGILILQQFSATHFNLFLHLYPMPEEGWLLLAITVLGAMAAFMPAIKAFGINISKTLAHEV
jgi:putative ABC transport system permease protein